MREQQGDFQRSLRYQESRLNIPRTAQGEKVRHCVFCWAVQKLPPKLSLRHSHLSQLACETEIALPILHHSWIKHLIHPYNTAPVCFWHVPSIRVHSATKTTWYRLDTFFCLGWIQSDCFWGPRILRHLLHLASVVPVTKKVCRMTLKHRS